MKFLECDLEEIIMKSKNEDLQARGLKIYGKKLNQVPIGNYGRADVITLERRYACWDEEINPFVMISVYELKKNSISVSALLQAVRYCKGICQWMESNRPRIDFSIKLKLIGSSVDTTSDFVYLADLLNSNEDNPTSSIVDISFYTFNYNIDGLRFDNQFGFSLIDQGF